MHIERLTLTNFRCFGPGSTSIALLPTLNAFVGDNGTGKTAVMQALQRMFGVTADVRRVRKQDFHVPHDEAAPLPSRSLVVEAIVAFPELDDDPASPAVAEFFRNMAADEHGNLKCRLRLQATWTDDGTLDGNVEEKYWAVQTFGDFEDGDLHELRGPDRSRIQCFYIPATRDGVSQVSAFVRGRLWRAIDWSNDVRESLSTAGAAVNTSFGNEPAVSAIAAAVESRWQQLHSAGTDATPIFRPVDTRWQEFIRRVEVVFHPDEHGHERDLAALSDGQRSLFHLAMAAATLDIEAGLSGNQPPSGFGAAGVPLPALTIVAVEEPENNLAPFYLSRIIKQVLDVAARRNAQAIVSSHSPSILARVEPEAVRHFRLDFSTRTSVVSAITLPQGEEAASKFVREAVRTYPELYFARHVILGEGATEEVVIPILANAVGLPIDRSFVAVVPLGGRHVNHLWRLLTDLKIPHVTLLDLDLGRSGGGIGRIKNVCRQLLETGTSGELLFGPLRPGGVAAHLADLDTPEAATRESISEWLTRLRTHGVFFSSPLDLDQTMLSAYTQAYTHLEAGELGPRATEPRPAVLGDDGDAASYLDEWTPTLRWYRYLFLGRGKPSTHVRVLSQLDDAALLAAMPEHLGAMLQMVRSRLEVAAA